MVSNRMTCSVLQFETERRRSLTAIEERIAFAVEQAQAVAQPQVSVQVELRMLRVVQPRVEREESARIDDRLQTQR